MDRVVRILFASRYVREKGSDILSDLIKSLLDHPIPGVHIEWYVTSMIPNTDKISEFASDKKNSIYLTGRLSQKELADLYRKVDILYMPSRFLETFGLTALEALASGVRIVGIRKGGLISFIEKDDALDENDLIHSSRTILERICKDQNLPSSIDINPFRRNIWNNNVSSLFEKNSRIALLHDYFDPIGGAEVYVDFLEGTLSNLSYTVFRHGYIGKTTPWKRRVLFMVSSLSFHRGIILYRFLHDTKPDIVWMHSILRYFGFWGIFAYFLYQKSHKVQLYVSHHDVGLIAPFPQNIEQESQIPKDNSLASFLKGLAHMRKVVAFFKWFYVLAITKFLPNNTIHVIFSPFLKKHIENHFPHHKIRVLPHTYDENIFHP